MNLVVLTAALSSVNTGLYATARMLRPLAIRGSAPRFLGKMSDSGVPTGGIWLTAGMFVLGVILNFFVPKQAFEIVLNLGAAAILGNWCFICCSHIAFMRAVKAGKAERPHFKAPFGVFGDALVIAALLGIAVLMGFDYPLGTSTLALALLGMIPMFFIGWYATGRTREAATKRLRRKAREKSASAKRKASQAGQRIKLRRWHK